MVANSESAMSLRDLLITTKDGDWGKTTPQDGYVPYRVIRGADFPNVRVGNISAIPLCYLNPSTVERRTLIANDILIETAGGNRDRPTGRTLLITERLLQSLDLSVTCASFCRFLRVNPKKAHPAYVYWYLQALYRRGDMWEHQVQHTGVARFQYTKFAEATKIPLPSPKEQEDIARIFSAFDDKIELNRKMNTTLEGMAQALFKSWFVDFDPVTVKAQGRTPEGMDAETAALFPGEFEESKLGLIPKGWRAVSLADICTTQYGYTESAVDEPVGPHFLRVMDINKQNWIDWAKVPYCIISERDFQKYRLQVGDVLVARMADPGKSAIIETDEDAVFASYLVRLKASNISSAYYVYFLLKSDSYLKYTDAVKSGAVQANMNAKVIVGVETVLPGGRIVDAFFQSIKPIRQKINCNVAQSSLLAALRDALLPKLISGQLRIPDAEKMAEAVL